MNMSCVLYKPGLIKLSALIVALVALLGCSPVMETSTDFQSALPVRQPTPVEIYQSLSPSVAFIETPTGTGSGPLVELDGGLYVVTNAHVVWPYSEARIVFPNRDEFDDVPLVQTDPLVDLAILGPLDVAIPPLEIDTVQELVPGEKVYLIGYPGEGELFPDPAITQGILSRTRVWDSIGDLRYYQTDTAGSGGQSGGILVSKDGEVVGVSGMLFADVFVLSVSSSDLMTRLDAMMADADAEFIRGTIPSRITKKKYSGELANLWDTEGFVVNAPLDSDVEFEVRSPGDYAIGLYDTFGDEMVVADTGYSGSEVISDTISTDGPHFVIIEQYYPEETEYTIDSTHRFELVEDPDDGQLLSIGDSVSGVIDYPGDTDWYILPLGRGEKVELSAESTAFDTVLAIGPLQGDVDEYTRDDDSGRGLLGANSLLEYRARKEGDYLVVVRAFSNSELGGFILQTGSPEN